jgi:thiamine pyrophosphate-dependent acetolactate synthase large subunit-like protein
VNLDAGMQEAPLTEPPPPIDPARFMPPVATAAPDDLVAQATTLLRQARRPIMLIGRVGRSEQGWKARVALAEQLQVRVVSDLKVGAVFPTDHPLHAAPPAGNVLSEAAQMIAEADVILSLDWVDLAGTLRSACGSAAPNAKVIQVSMDHHLHNGWSMDHQALPPADLFLAADPDVVVEALLRRLGPQSFATVQPPPQPAASSFAPGPIAVPTLGEALRHATGDRPVSLLHLPISWNAAVWPFRHPLDFIGSDGGGGIGGGPGISVGGALALRGSGRLPVSVCGDGDFLMGVTALWTAVHYRIPLLLVVANNRSFFNDELHQERVARMRNRPVENRWIGQRISDPDIDMAKLAEGQGATGFGPVEDAAALVETFQRAIAVVEAGGVAVVDVRVTPGYTAATTAVMLGTGRG